METALTFKKAWRPGSDHCYRVFADGEEIGYVWKRATWYLQLGRNGGYAFYWHFGPDQDNSIDVRSTRVAAAEALLAAREKATTPAGHAATVGAA